MWARIVFRGHEIVFLSHEIVFRGHEIVFRVFRGHEIVFRGHEIVFRGHEIKQTTKIKSPGSGPAIVPRACLNQRAITFQD